SLGKLPQASLTGMAADDISHLLAELLDNATANSPEHAQVVISAQRLDDGKLMIVVEDEGVGIPEPQLVELNERLRGAPVLDDEIRRHMGLYVAGRIAHKHGLEIRLEARSFRGISAYTIIPEQLLRVATPPSPRRAGAPSTSTRNPPAPPGPSLPVLPATARATLAWPVTPRPLPPGCLDVAQVDMLRPCGTHRVPGRRPTTPPRPVWTHRPSSPVMHGPNRSVTNSVTSSTVNVRHAKKATSRRTARNDALTLDHAHRGRTCFSYELSTHQNFSED